MGYQDFRSHLAALEERNLVYRVDELVNKDTELMPVVRWQYRGLPESERKAFHFTNVTDSNDGTYEHTSGVVLSAVGASSEVYASGLDCTPKEIRDKWLDALANPMDTTTVTAADAPCKEVIIRGDELQKDGLARLPFAVSTPGWDPSPYLTSGHFHTRDPETGIRNVGNYRAMLKATDRVGVQIFPTQHIGIHWTKAQRLGRNLEAAIIIGAAPTISMAAAAKVPYGVDELMVAGALAGESIQTVQCETVDIEVPAWAEIVIEGEISTGYVEPEGPFGEFSGHMGEPAEHPVFHVKCITHRRQPYVQMFISQFPPSESTKIRSFANEAVYFDTLHNRCNIPAVQDIVFHEPSGAQAVIVIQMDKTSPAQPWQALQIANALDPTYGKVVIAVDADVDPYDFDAVLWAMAMRMQPELDVQILRGQASMLDPSSAHPDLPKEQQWYPEPRGTSAMLIDATRKWDYPPVSLPTEEFMTRAREIWETAGLPKLSPKSPWYGYRLGAWPEECDEDARLAIEGRWEEVGKRMERERRNL